MSGPDAGATGLHTINGALVSAGALGAIHSQSVIYEATPSGGLRLMGADSLLFQAAWDAKNPAPPQLMGQAFHWFDAPNRFGAPCVLHAACLGVEGQSQRRVRELARQRFVAVHSPQNH